MRTSLKLLVLLAVAVAAALLLRDSSGYFMVVTGDERRTLSLAAGLVFIVLAFFVFYLLFRFIGFLMDAPSRIRNWNHRRHTRKDYDLLERGWMELLEGRSSPAEKDLTRLLNRSRDSGRQALASLAAAKAAHNQGRYAERDALLLTAQSKAEGNSRMQDATATIRAEMLLEQGEAKQALGLLEPLAKSGGANQDHIQKLLLRGYKQIGNQDKLLDVARTLNRKGTIDPFEGQRLIEHAGAAVMKATTRDSWANTWKMFSSAEKTMPLIALAAAEKAQAAGHPDTAGQILETSLRENVDARLLNAYVQCPQEQVNARLTKAQKWLEKDENNPDLLNALGFLCLAAQLWGQAERYLTRSLKLRDDPRTHSLLGALYDRLGKPAEAVKHWRLASASVSMLPVVAGEKYLPAADTRLDPDGPPDRKRAEAETEVSRTEDGPPEKAIYAKRPETDDEYFDSAPIPGLRSEELNEKS